MAQVTGIFPTLACAQRLALCSALLLSGDTSGPAWSMDLLQAYHAAQENDATARAARAAAMVGDERVAQARAQFYPSLNFTAGRNHNNVSRAQRTVSIPPLTTQERYASGSSTLTLRQPLYRKGIAVGLEQAQQSRGESNAALERELQNLGVRVAEAYFQVLLAQDHLGLSQAQKLATTTQLQAARKMWVGGSGTRTDVDEAQARLDMALAQELEVVQHLDYARRQLQTLVQLSGDTPLSPLDTDRFAAWQPALLPVDDWIARAEDHSPEIRQLRARLELARLAIERARSEHLPTLDAVAQWTRSTSENVTTPGVRYTHSSIGVQLNVPLYGGGYVSSTVRQAIAEETQARELLEAARRDLGLRVHAEYRAVSEGKLRVRALEQAARSAQQLVVSSRRSLAGGVRTQIDVLNAEQQKEMTLRDLARARYALLVAMVKLQALTGGDRESSIQAINALLVKP
jgi:protease secretion system outer membrane protein